MPLFMLPPINDRLPVPPERSPMAVVPLESSHCARMKIPLAHAQEAAQDNHTTAKMSILSPTTPKSNAPKLLQLLPPSEMGRRGSLTSMQLQYLSSIATRMTICRCMSGGARGSRRHTMENMSSQWNGPVAASLLPRQVPRPVLPQHQVAVVEVVQKLRKIEDVVQLPLKVKPQPTSNSKIKELAELCGFKATGTFREAALMKQAAQQASDAGTSANV